MDYVLREERRDNRISIRSIYLRMFKDANVAVFLSQLLYWSDGRGSLENGWIWKTANDWEEETGLTRKKQERVRSILREFGILEERKQGVPATLHFRCNEKVLDKMEHDFISGGETSFYKRSKLDSTKGKNCIPPKVESISYTTTDITTKKSLPNSPHLSLYKEIREAWFELLPTRPAPRPNNKTLQQKVKTRMKDSFFMENWEAALRRASKSTFLTSKWPGFDLGWFLANDNNWQKVLNGNYDDDDRTAPTLSADDITRAIKKYKGREGKARAQEELDEQIWGVIEGMGGWIEVCNMNSFRLDKAFRNAIGGVQ